MVFDLSQLSLSNAAGMVKTRADARKLLGSATTRIEIGSIMLDERPGNQGETYYLDEQTMASYNAMGLPNPAPFADTLVWLGEFMVEAADQGQQTVLNVAGSTPAEYAEIIDRAQESADHFVVNAGCGNFWQDNAQKAIPSYHPELLAEILDAICAKVGTIRNVMVKISPIEEDRVDTLIAVAEVIAASPIVSEVIAVNTKINQRGVKPDGSPALAFRESQGAELKHTGGMGGKLLKPEGLRVVREMRRLLPDCIKVVGCGGIFGGRDLLDYVDLGASGIQVGTAFFTFGPKVFADILAEADSILESA